MPTDSQTYPRIKAARSNGVKSSNSYYTISMLAGRLMQYAVDNRIGNGEVVDMAFLEFLENRGVTLKDIPSHDAKAVAEDSKSVDGAPAIPAV